MSPEMNLKSYMLQRILADLVQTREEIESNNLKLPKTVNSFFELDKDTQADIFISLYNKHWIISSNKFIAIMKNLKFANPEDILEYVHRMIIHSVRKLIKSRNGTGIEINKEYESNINIIIKRIVRN